jgi:hypothetical protein
LSVGLGAGDDALTIRNAAVGGVASLPALSATADPWNYTVRRRGASLVQAIDAVAARLARGRGTTATVRSGSGDDQVQIVDAAFHQLAVGLDNGDDALLLDGVHAGLARLHGGSGVDAMTTTERNEIERQTVESFATTTSPAAATQTSGPVIRRRRR